MSIEIPEAVIEAVRKKIEDHYEPYYADRQDALDVIAILKPALEAAIRADIEQKLIDWTVETHYEDVTSVFASSLTPLLAVICEAFAALAEEGTDATS